jgi:hypothetical protein
MFGLSLLYMWAKSVSSRTRRGIHPYAGTVLGRWSKFWGMINIESRWMDLVVLPCAIVNFFAVLFLHPRLLVGLFGLDHVQCHSEVARPVLQPLDVVPSAVVPSRAVHAPSLPLDWLASPQQFPLETPVPALPQSIGGYADFLPVLPTEAVEVPAPLAPDMDPVPPALLLAQPVLDPAPEPAPVPAVSVVPLRPRCAFRAARYYEPETGCWVEH